MRLWRRRDGGPADRPREQPRNDAEAVAARVRHVAAVEALRAALPEPAARCVLDALSAPSWTAPANAYHSTGPLPPSEVVLEALRLVGAPAPALLVQEYVASEPVEPRTGKRIGALQEQTTQFWRWVREDVAGWRLPAEVDTSAHGAAQALLQDLDHTLREQDLTVNIERGLATARWWPGRPEPLGVDVFSEYFAYRVGRERSAQPPREWWAALKQVTDLGKGAAGLPPVNPAHWVVSASDHWMRTRVRTMP